VLPPRASDATALVDFVPVDAEGNSRRAAAAARAEASAPPASRKPAWLERNGRTLLAVVLAVDAALLAWRLLAH